MTWFLDTALVAGGVGLVAGAFVPRLIARIPEPVPEPAPVQADEGDGVEAPPPVPADGLVPAENEAEFSRPVDEPKELYVDLAARRGLWWQCAVAGALTAGAMGGRIGWHPVLLLLLYLVPVGIALSVIDWRTRYLPSWLIRPSYLVVGVLAVLAAVLTSDWNALTISVVGWLSSFAFFWVMWFIYPRGMAYGDVRLAGLLGMALGWLGVPQLVLGLYSGFLIGGIGGGLLAALRVFHRKHYPFGPFMIVGAFLGVVIPGELASMYGWVITGVESLIQAALDSF